jgi:hypothetical protein
MKKRLKIAGIALLLVLVAVQFIRPDRNNPPNDPNQEIGAIFPVPGPVQQILDRSCIDCHSNRTRWPWYSSIAPISWVVASDVKEGREHMNFSEWGTYNRGRIISRLDMIVSQVDKGDMPLPGYLLLHRDARLTEEQKDTLCSWAERSSDSLTSSTK